MTAGEVTVRAIDLRGVQMHIGSQITEAEPFVAAIENLRHWCPN